MAFSSWNPLFDCGRAVDSPCALTAAVLRGAPRALALNTVHRNRITARWPRFVPAVVAAVVAAAARK